MATWNQNSTRKTISTDELDGSSSIFDGFHDTFGCGNGSLYYHSSSNNEKGFGMNNVGVPSFPLVLLLLYCWLRPEEVPVM